MRIWLSELMKLKDIVTKSHIFVVAIKEESLKSNRARVLDFQLSKFCLFPKKSHPKIIKKRYDIPYAGIR